MSKMKILLNGIIKENPAFVLVLGTCPMLAVTTLAVNGIGMGLATTFVLVCSNVLISMLKSVIPEKVRIPAYIVIIAGFVTIVGQIISAYFPDLDKSLGIFIPLIVVNCIILGRAEMFASKNPVFSSFLDGVSMGVGFTLALVIIGSVRELLGFGTLFGISITAELFSPIAVFTMPPGGFITYGVVIAIVNKITKSTAEARRKKACVVCPAARSCPDATGEDN